MPHRTTIVTSVTGSAPCSTDTTTAAWRTPTESPSHSCRFCPSCVGIAQQQAADDPWEARRSRACRANPWCPTAVSGEHRLREAPHNPHERDGVLLDSDPTTVVVFRTSAHRAQTCKKRRGSARAWESGPLYRELGRSGHVAVRRGLSAAPNAGERPPGEETLHGHNRRGFVQCDARTGGP